MTSRIALSIGNTRISYGVFADGQLDRTQHHLLDKMDDVIDDLVSQATRANVQKIAFTSVVPTARGRFIERAGQRNFELFEVNGDSQTLLTGLYAGLGADRIANAAAAYKLFSKKSPVAVLDFGTATTMTVVSETGQFLGGLITLGLGKTAEALHQMTAQLPKITAEIDPHSGSLLANDTKTAMKNGCVLAHIGLIEQWVKVAKNSAGAETRIVATGGYASHVRSMTKVIDEFDSHLTLRGIDVIAEAATVPGDRG